MNVVDEGNKEGISKKKHRGKRSKQWTSTCSIYSLSHELLVFLFSCIGEGHFYYIAGTCGAFHDSYIEHYGAKTNMGNSIFCAERFTEESEDGIEFTIPKIRIAASTVGNLAVLNWSKNVSLYWKMMDWSNRFTPHWQVSSVDIAIRREHIHILEWLRCNNYISKKHTCKMAAKIGSVRVLQWAHKRYGWDESTTLAAAEYGNLDCLQYALQNGCPYDEDEILGLPLLHTHVQRWMIQNSSRL